MDKFNIPHNLYGFSLSGMTIKILWRLKPLSMCYNVWLNNIDHYLDILIHDQPKYILGLDTQRETDHNDITIECLANNQFRNTPIETDLEITKTISLNPFIKQTNQAILVSTPEDSLCNLVSWRIGRLIEQGTLQSQYTLLYIPPILRWKATDIIEALLKSSISI
ncbi:MAG TPA: hypothetical protein VMR41_05975 [Patescibacteria group bacterium]|nr:hypothetical protein [Patescibacteria group bacterium]